MCLPYYRYSLFVISILCFVRCEDLPSYNVEGQCDNTLSETQTAGVIKFEGLTYFTDCLITVAPQKLDTGPGKVMLYFTEFILPSPCSSINVTVLDGDDPRYALPVKGLPNALCKRNTTLAQTGMVFNTTSSKFALLIRRKVYDVPTTGSFVLKFSSFSDGPCPDLDSITTCKSGRCTPSQFHCHDDIDTCGSSEEEVCSKDEDSLIETIGRGLWDIVRNVLIVIAIMIAFVCLSGFIRSVRQNNTLSRLKEMIGRGLSNCCSFLSSIRSFRSSDSPSRNTEIDHSRQADTEDRDSVSISTFRSAESHISSRHSSPEEVDSSVLPPSYDDLETGHPEAYSNRASFSSTSSDVVNPHSVDLDVSPEAPPSYSELDHCPSAPPIFPDTPPTDIPDAPPPSYDDYMSNEQIYKNESDI